MKTFLFKWLTEFAINFVAKTAMFIVFYIIFSIALSESFIVALWELGISEETCSNLVRDIFAIISIIMTLIVEVDFKMDSLNETKREIVEAQRKVMEEIGAEKNN